jgi:hypothetical protein
MSSCERAAKKARKDELNRDEHLLRQHGSTFASAFENKAAMHNIMKPDAVGKKFVVVFEYEDFESESEDVKEEEEQEEEGKYECEHERFSEHWAARVGTLRAIGANVNTNSMMCSFSYDEESACGTQGGAGPQLARMICVPHLSYSLYSTPCSMEQERVKVFIPPAFRATIEAAGHTELAYFGEYDTVQRCLASADHGSSFLIVYSHYGGWSAFVATFVRVDTCLPGVPQYVFDYVNNGEGPLFCTDESQLPHNLLPQVRLGPHVGYYLFSVPRVT